MFGNMGPSLSDIAAVTENNRSNSGWGGDGGWWVLIILFALFGGWGRNGYGASGGGGNDCCNGINSGVGAEVQRGFDNQGAMNKLNGLEQGICGLGYDQLNQMNSLGQTVMQTGWGIQNSIQQMGVASMQDTNAISRQLSDCCCENRMAISQVRNDMAANACAITTAINQASQNIIQNDNANYRQLHDEMFAIQMQAKDEKIADQAAMINALQAQAISQSQATYLVNQLRPTPVPSYQVANPYAGFGYGHCGNNNGCCGGC